MLINDFLSHSKRILVGSGPESIEELNGYLYSGLKNGSLVQLNPTTGETVIIYAPESKTCGGDEYEHICGRILGIRKYSDKELIFVEAYSGLYKFNVETKTIIQLIAANDTRFDNRPLRFINDLDILDKQYIFFTDSDWLYPRRNFVSTLLRSNPRGRLIRYDIINGKVRTFNNQLSFPNGVQLTVDQQAVLICETSLARIMRFWINGPKTGKTDIFIENLPGICDNIRMTERKTYWIAFAAVRSLMKPTLVDRLRTWPLLRTLISYFPSWILNYFMHSSRHGLVIEVDNNGQILRSLHDPEGINIPSTSQVTEYNGYLYFGSYYLPYIGAFKL
ncbi:unnamed protein product [Didymodactylos carnosus]|uniref:Strictosidine synthase conserved region domain-containing protein n=1 Tax=Didymodactylos carnosus TaxID=1234261 RepID=A0A8S2K1C5_9BILA|nr:unnamed protein product [Didymodactylos carnosus]CAF3834738.1 unnamed protein product [Didymodactylos carnosus]